MRWLSAYALKLLAAWAAALPASYTTVSLCILGFPAINSVSTLNSQGIAQYIGGVEARINAFLAKRYPLPLTVDSPLLTMIATREAIYRIAVERGLVQFPPAQQGRAPLQVAHAEDEQTLKDLADGKIELTNSSGAIIPAGTTDLLLWSTTKGYVPTFHEGRWTDMVQDQTQIEDELAKRQL